MDIITLVLVLALVGFCLYLATTYIPMAEPIKQAITVVVVIVLILWVARTLLGGGPVLTLR